MNRLSCDHVSYEKRSGRLLRLHNLGAYHAVILETLNLALDFAHENYSLRSMTRIQFPCPRQRGGG